MSTPHQKPAFKKDNPLHRKRPDSAAPVRKKPVKKRARKLQKRPERNWALLAFECLGLSVAALLTTMLVLGHAANRFAGSGFFSNLLPFAVGVVVLIIASALLLILWSKLRLHLQTAAAMLPALLAMMLGLSSVWFVFHDGYAPVFTHFRTLVGGKQQAAQTTLAHQVYAAYRRYDETQLQKMIDRAATFNADVRDAAEAFSLDPDLLLGVAATESSFLPRDSRDGGHGLFQITAVPEIIMQRARNRLSVDKLSLADPRHNAYIAAATLKHYLAEMNDDLFLGLLAYNIGPRNGGLRFIMQQYGATDFVSMQPYLQQLPRDYPIRVLSHSVAFRLWHRNGKLLAYQDGDNAVYIQRIGIPGMQTAFD